jgi:hypothetical protein
MEEVRGEGARAGPGPRCDAGRTPRRIGVRHPPQQRPLTPEKRFTFARSEMATATTMFAKLGIPLQICVIP